MSSPPTVVPASRHDDLRGRDRRLRGRNRGSHVGCTTDGLIAGGMAAGGFGASAAILRIASSCCLVSFCCSAAGVAVRMPFCTSYQSRVSWQKVSRSVASFFIVSTPILVMSPGRNCIAPERTLVISASASSAEAFASAFADR